MSDHTPHTPAPSLWPIGFAVGVAAILVGAVVSVWALVVGAVVALVFGLLWLRDLTHRPEEPAAAEEGPAPAVATVAHASDTYDRSTFLTAATIGLGGVIGGIVTVPVLGFTVLPAFNGDASFEEESVDLGPITSFPENEFVIATYLAAPEQGEVSRRTAFIRNNGRAEGGQPSFTLLYSRCVHLGCPVQPNGPIEEDAKFEYEASNGTVVELRPVRAAGFGCPCHGGLYDSEGNRTAGPPVRALDRFQFSIRDGNLLLGKPFSVSTVEGTGARAQIGAYTRTYPGVHVDGASAWLYPLPVPGIDGGY